jgi:hypothetical protein
VTIREQKSAPKFPYHYVVFLSLHKFTMLNFNPLSKFLLFLLYYIFFHHVQAECNYEDYILGDPNCSNLTKNENGWKITSTISVLIFLTIFLAIFIIFCIVPVCLLGMLRKQRISQMDQQSQNRSELHERNHFNYVSHVCSNYPLPSNQVYRRFRCYTCNKDISRCACFEHFAHPVAGDSMYVYDLLPLPSYDQLQQLEALSPPGYSPSYDPLQQLEPLPPPGYSPKNDVNMV